VKKYRATFEGKDGSMQRVTLRAESKGMTLKKLEEVKD
jgi:hypothetical protein